MYHHDDGRIFYGMKRLARDDQGTMRCRNCGATGFVQKRSLKGKVALGLLAPKRMKCLGCGTLAKA